MTAADTPQPPEQLIGHSGMVDLDEAGWFLVRDNQAVHDGVVCDVVPFVLGARGLASLLRPVETP